MSNLTNHNRYKEYNYQAPRFEYKKETFVQKKRIKAPKRKKFAFVAFFVSFLLLALYGYFVCPYGYRHFIEPFFVNRILNRNIKLDVSGFINPTYEYLHNSYLLGEPLVVSVNSKANVLSQIVSNGELTSTKQKLLNLFEKYPWLHASVFVWDYSSAKTIEINADEIFPSASIIKVPIAIELIKKIEESEKTSSPISLKDKRLYTDEFKTLGSGHLQYTQSDVLYSLDHLANIMISESDNSATNMLLYEIGGVDGFNKAMRNYGLNVTSMGQWLPDLEGYNKITAREISTILYNINNSNYISPKYKNVIKEYLGSTKNIHLLKEKLPSDAMILHKTGNIGTMLGDSGIVYSANGRKYIVTILVKRPKNDLSARTMVQEASLIIYNDLNSLR